MEQRVYDLALLLYQNFISQLDKPQNVVGYDNESGSLVVQPNKQSKVKSIQNIEAWTDGFINYINIFLQRFPNSALELITYMSTIRGTNVQFDKIYRYDQQFRLRMANNPTRSWASIGGILWFTIIANGSSLNTTNQQIQVSNRPCWNYNFKGLCIRQLCNYKHACLKCGLAHPFAYCTRAVNQSYANTPSSVRTVNYNAARPIRQDVHRAQQSFSRPPFLNRGPRPVINRFPVIKFPLQYNA